MFFDFFTYLALICKNLFKSFFSSPPSLSICGFLIKPIIGSTPILDWPPSNINLIFFPNSSTTSSFFTGLILVAIFALGAASGYLSLLNSFLVNGCFGNLTAKVFLWLVTFFEIILFSFNFKTNEIGPGQNFLYNFINFLLIKQLFWANLL